MRLFCCKNKKLKFLGITIFKKKYRNQKIIYYFLFIPLFSRKSELYSIYKDFKKNDSIDTTDFDIKISHFIDKNFSLPKFEQSFDNKKIILLATEIYDYGGHTECIKNLVAAAPEEQDFEIFLTHLNISQNKAPNKLAEISKYSIVDGINVNLDSDKTNIKKLIQTYSHIIKEKPSAIISFLHMDDVFGVTLLALIKKYTQIHIFFWNHASHEPTLGMAFADLIFEGTPTTERITRERRGYHNTAIIGLPYLTEESLPVITDNLIKSTRKSIGIPDGAMCSMTGCASYKLFVHNHSPYFEMIERLLIKESNLYHVVITELNQEQQQILTEIFKNSDVLKRLIFLPFTADYKVLFKSCDLFIDSFPVSSALTHIDLMSLKVPNVVKINSQNLTLTFHEYMEPDYPYSFEETEDIEIAIILLLHNETQRKLLAEKNYIYFLNHYEGKKSVKRILDLIVADN